MPGNLLSRNKALRKEIHWSVGHDLLTQTSKFSHGTTFFTLMINKGENVESFLSVWKIFTEKLARIVFLQNTYFIGRVVMRQNESTNVFSLASLWISWGNSFKGLFLSFRTSKFLNKSTSLGNIWIKDDFQTDLIVIWLLHDK